VPADLAPPAPPFAVVGNINLDLRTSPVDPTPSLFADGETSLESVQEAIGGGGANTALAAARMGGAVHFCGCVGDDELGTRLAARLRGFGVATHIAVKPVATGRSIALCWSNHHRHFLSSLPNTACLGEEDVDVAALASLGCRHLYRADAWFSDPMLFGGNARLLRAARARGIDTSIDINWDPAWLQGRAAPAVAARIDALGAALAHVTWVHGNERELLFFTGASEIRDAARRLLDLGAGGVIVHRGPRGCAALEAGEWIEVPARPVARIASETGTGDVFTAAFLCGQGTPLPALLEECGRRAAEHLEGTIAYLPPL
jgi:sugar/nucleoside kinase (ribokinase family)